MALLPTNVTSGTTGHVGDSNQAYKKLNGLCVDVKADYNAVGNGVADDATAINNAISAASAAGGGTVYLPAGTYRVGSPIVPASQVYIRGAGITTTVVKLANAANCDVFLSPNFSTLTLTGASTWGASGINDFGIANMSIDGNRANQTGTSYGIRMYGYDWILENLDVRSCFTDGLWTEWGALTSDAPAASDGSESTGVNVRAHHNGQNGWVFLGPSDCRLVNCEAFKNNQAAGSTSIGFWALQDQISNILLTASGMNGTAATGFTGTFTVQTGTPTTFYASSGTLSVTTSTGTATMTYTGKTSTTFTGCAVTSGGGTFQTGNKVVNAAELFATNGLQVMNMHVWSNDHKWAAVLDGQTSSVNSHWEGAEVGQLLIRNSANIFGGFLYDFTGITPGCGIQLGDDGTTTGLPATFPVAANACNVNTQVAAHLNDTAKRASLRWVSCSQSNVQLLNVTKTTGTYTTTVAAGSNGVDVSTFTGGSPGVINVATTNQIPKGAGALTVATSSGTVTVTYADHNGTQGSSRNSGTQFTGVVAQGSPPGGSNMSTGGAVALQNVGTVAYTGSVDGASKLSVHSQGPTTTISANASYSQQYGAYIVDAGTAGNAFTFRANGQDRYNVNNQFSQIQWPNSQQIIMYNDNYATKQIVMEGWSGVVHFKGVNVLEGTNARMGTATLVAGTVVVSTTAVTASSRIFLTAQSTGGTAGALRVSARTAGTSFTITSTSGTDTSVVAWQIFEPATL